jgi:hypothetical protein
MGKSTDHITENDRYAEWAILGILSLVGLYFMFDVLFLSEGDETVFIPLGKAILSAVLFAVSVWAAFRVGGVLAAFCTLPLLVTAALSFIAPPVDRVEALELAAFNLSTEFTTEVGRLGAAISVLDSRLSRVGMISTVTYSTNSARSNNTYNIAGSSINHMCYIEGLRFRGSNDHDGEVQLIRPSGDGQLWRVRIQSGNSDIVNASISCLGLPIE